MFDVFLPVQGISQCMHVIDQCIHWLVLCMYANNACILKYSFCLLNINNCTLWVILLLTPNLLALNNTVVLNLQIAPCNFAAVVFIYRILHNTTFFLNQFVGSQYLSKSFVGNIHLRFT